MTTGTDRPGRMRHAASGLHDGTRERALCAEPGCPAAVGNARRQKRLAATTPRGSKTAHADFLITLSSSLARRAAHHRGTPQYSESETPLVGRGGDDAPENRLIGDAVIGVSDRLRCFRGSALTALPPLKPSVPSRG
jgi:hypothetical protein